MLRVVSGDATPEEIAAVVAAVTAASTSTASTGATSTAHSAPTPTSVWSSPGYAHRNIRATFTPGPNGWRTSFWPR